MAYILKREKQIQTLHLLVEGSSLRSITRLTGIHRTTVMNLMVEFGHAAARSLMHGSAISTVAISRPMKFGHLSEKSRDD